VVKNLNNLDYEDGVSNTPIRGRTKKAPVPRGIRGPNNPTVHPDYTGSNKRPTVDDGYGFIIAYFREKSREIRRKNSAQGLKPGSIPHGSKKFIDKPKKVRYNSKIQTFALRKSVVELKNRRRMRKEGMSTGSYVSAVMPSPVRF
jgi:hypothetical protein